MALGILDKVPDHPAQLLPVAHNPCRVDLAKIDGHPVPGDHALLALVEHELVEVDRVVAGHQMTLVAFAGQEQQVVDDTL